MIQTLLTRLAPCLLLGLLWGMPFAVHAHAVVTESSLKHHPIEINHPTEVALYFNAGVELALSKVFLVSKGDVYHDLQIAKGKKPGQILINVPALEEGDYAIKYKIFAADGHLTEDVIRFKVAGQR